MAIPKSFFLLALATLSIVFIGIYFVSKEPSVDTTEQLQAELELLEDQQNIDELDFSLFTDTLICKAITNAVAGANPEIMRTTILEDKFVISFKREADGKDLSYNCKKVRNRFYLESTSKFFSQSIIEVEPKVTAPRTDELTLYIFDTSDTGNIVKTYMIDELE